MDSAILAANDRQNDVMQDEETLRTYWRCEMARMDLNGQLEYARDEGYGDGMEQGYKEGQMKGIEQGMEQGYKEGQMKGIEQGMEQGYKEGQMKGIEQTTFEIARKMKSAGRPLTEIESFTNLPPGVIDRI